MRFIVDPLSFNWDEGNQQKNLRKHAVSSQEAEEIFANEPFTTTNDRRHSSVHEQRFHALGQTKAGRKLFAAFTIRNNKVRIISVRDMSKKERTAYEKLETDS